MSVEISDRHAAHGQADTRASRPLGHKADHPKRERTSSMWLRRPLKDSVHSTTRTRASNHPGLRHRDSVDTAAFPPASDEANRDGTLGDRLSHLASSAITVHGGLEIGMRPNVRAVCGCRLESWQRPALLRAMPYRTIGPVVVPKGHRENCVKIRGLTGGTGAGLADCTRGPGVATQTNRGARCCRNKRMGTWTTMPVNGYGMCLIRNAALAKVTCWRY